MSAAPPVKAKQPKTIQVTPAEMDKRIARFKVLRPQSEYYDRGQGIPGEAYEMVTAKTLYNGAGAQRHPGCSNPRFAGYDGRDLLALVQPEWPPRQDRPAALESSNRRTSCGLSD